MTPTGDDPIKGPTMTTKHTPGPWTVCDAASEFHEIHQPESVRSRAFGKSNQMGDYRGVIVCTLADAHGDRPHAFAECRANAQLIAASPAILEKLRDVETYLGDFCDQGVRDTRHPAYELWLPAHELLLSVQAIIAQVDGR